jgi:hypothetical protein
MNPAVAKPRSPSARIDLERLLRAAQRNAGWRSLGAHGNLHWEGLTRLAQSIEREHGSIDPQGATVLNQQFLDRMESLLHFERDLARCPEIARVPVERPIFIVDFGRSASTLLHNLLALDPNARAPRLWELWNPSPPPRPETYETDDRIARARQRLEVMRKFAPTALDIHPLEATGPEECQWLMRHGTHYAMLHNAVGYWEWLRDLDDVNLGGLFSYYRLQVQHLQLHCRRDYWLSKSQSHLHYLPVLLRTFPDARIVRLHRDPCKIVPSLCSLYQNVRAGFTRSGAGDGFGALMLDIFADGMKRMIEADRHTPAAQVIDVFFTDLIGDPRASVRRIYRHFAMTYTDRLDTDLRAHTNASGQPSSAHRYRLEEFGLTRDKVMRRAAPYLTWLEARTGADVARAMSR